MRAAYYEVFGGPENLRVEQRPDRRVVYRIDEPARTVHVVRIDHRADVYRAR